MFPSTLALVDDDPEHTEFFSQYLRAQGVRVTVFADSNDLLTGPEPFEYGFYVVDLSLPGVDGLELIKLLRRRTDVGVLVVSGRLSPDVFGQAMAAGADMYLAKPVQFEQVGLAIQAVQRRTAQHAQAGQVWKLDRLARHLVAPDGAHVELSALDMTVLGCFLQARGAAVTRETFLAALRKDADGGATDGLNATIFRLRRRIERASQMQQPLQSKPRLGYVFRGQLKEI